MYDVQRSAKSPSHKPTVMSAVFGCAVWIQTFKFSRRRVVLVFLSAVVEIAVKIQNYHG